MKEERGSSRRKEGTVLWISKDKPERGTSFSNKKAELRQVEKPRIFRRWRRKGRFRERKRGDRPRRAGERIKPKGGGSDSRNKCSEKEGDGVFFKGGKKSRGVDD